MFLGVWKWKWVEMRSFFIMLERRQLIVIFMNPHYKYCNISSIRESKYVWGILLVFLLRSLKFLHLTDENIFLQMARAVLSETIHVMKKSNDVLVLIYFLALTSLWYTSCYCSGDACYRNEFFACEVNTESKCNNFIFIHRSRSQKEAV